MISLNFKKIPRVSALLFVLVCFVLVCFLVAPAYPADITLSWDKPEGEVKGYNIYYGKSGVEYKTAPQIVISDPEQTSCVITGLEPGALYGFTTTSIDIAGAESSFSEELFHNISENGENLLNDEWTEDEQIDGKAKKAKKEAESVPAMTVADLTETFHTVQMFDNGGFGTGLMKVTFDGAGNLVQEELNKSAAADPAPLGTTYSVEGNGGLTIEGVEKGAVTQGGTYFAAGRMAVGNLPRMMFGIKAGAGITVAGLTGNYNLFMFTAIPDPATGKMAVTTATGSVAADGLGNLAPINGAFAATCTVDGTGQLAITPADTYSQMNGALSPDGSVFAAVDTDVSDGTLLFVIGMKGAETLTPAAMTGSYHVNDFEYTDPAAPPAGSYGQMSVTEDGGYTLSEIANSCDCPPETATGVITPGVNGEIQAVDATTSETASGGMALSGEIFTAMTEQSFSVGVRQASAEAKSGGGGGGGGCFIETLF